MSEERKLILQMVAEGKITPDEAEQLLAAIDESERTARDAAAEGVRSSAGAPAGPGVPFENLGTAIDRAVNESLQGLEEMLKHMEIKLHRHVDSPAGEELRQKIEEKMRRAAEKAAERARHLEERAARAAERAAANAERMAERIQERMERHMAREERHAARDERPAHERVRIIKAGIAIDRETVDQTLQLTAPAAAGDRVVVESRVGDIRVEFYEGTELQAEVKKTVWGEDKADAEMRASATHIDLVRRGTDIVAEVTHPSISAVGVLIVKDTRIDYTIKAPYGTHLLLNSKVGDLKVTSDRQPASWNVETKVGDVDLTVSPEAGFRYTIHSDLGGARVDVVNPATSTHEEQTKAGLILHGKVGDGSGTISARVKTGDIRLHN